MKTIHINCDLGEELDNEDLLMPFISACNIACGGHAGNKEIIENLNELYILNFLLLLLCLVCSSPANKPKDTMEMML